MIMEKISEIEYIISYEELMSKIEQGYYIVRDLKIAIEEGLITADDDHIRVYMDNNRRLIDIFSSVNYDEHFRRYRFTDIGEVFPDKKLRLPDCFGHIIENDQPLKEPNFCMSCKYYNACCNKCESLQIEQEEQNRKDNAKKRGMFIIDKDFMYRSRINNDISD